MSNIQTLIIDIIIANPQIHMLLEIVFGMYFILLQLSVFILGLNCIRIRDKTQLHPRIACFVFPVCINLILCNTVFKGIPSMFSTLFSCIFSLMLEVKMEKVRVIGITGSIATGKSTLTKLIKNNFKQINLIDCDQISRNLRKRGQPGYKLLINMLGERAEEYLNPLTRQFDEQGRQKLNKYVFNNEEFRKKLTKKMGQLIIIRVFKQVFVNIITGKNIMAIDAPLLFQTKILEYICYPIALVGCSEQTQIDRLMNRDGYTQQEAKKRISTQMSIADKRRKTKLYLQNQGSEQDLLRQFSLKIKRYLSSQIPQNYHIPNNPPRERKNIRQDDD